MKRNYALHRLSSNSKHSEPAPHLGYRLISFIMVLCSSSVLLHTSSLYVYRARFFFAKKSTIPKQLAEAKEREVLPASANPNHQTTKNTSQTLKRVNGGRFGAKPTVLKLTIFSTPYLQIASLRCIRVYSVSFLY